MTFLKTRLKPSDNSLFEFIYDVVFQIPPGKVATYGQVAKCVGSSCDPRMVGWALASLGNRREEIPVPWQRVVGIGGKISLQGSEQRELLEKEGIQFDIDGRIDMDLFGWETEDYIGGNMDLGE